MRSAIVVAGGSGERFGRVGGKQLARVAGVPVLTHALRAFDACESVGAVVVVCDPDRIDEFRRVAVEGAEIRKVVAVVAGGSTRRRSVANGLAALPRDCDVVVIHDGARALVDPAMIDAAVAALVDRSDVDGIVVGHPAYDTIKEVDAAGRIVATLERSRLWIAQTPQVFRMRTLVEAHALAERDGFEGTDDASLLERTGARMEMIEGTRWNLKVTVPRDLDVVAALLAPASTGDSSDG